MNFILPHCKCSYFNLYLHPRCPQASKILFKLLFPLSKGVLRHLVSNGNFFMKLIPLSQNRNCKNKKLNLFAQIDDDDFELVNKYIWQLQKSNSNNGRYYAVTRIGEKMVKMHRLIMKVYDPKQTVDHKIHLETLNNQKSNLRIATILQQSWNRPKQKQSRSMYKGVAVDIYKSKNGVTKKYRMNMRVNGVKIRKSFNTEIEAAKAYDEMALNHFGEFAVLNFPKPLELSSNTSALSLTNGI